MNRDAPTGQVFICQICGNESKDLYGDKKLSPVWDMTCQANAVLVFENSRRRNNEGLVFLAEAVPVPCAQND